MRTIDEYMKLPYKAEVTPDMDEGGFVASYPELVGCVTCGETMEKALANLLDAKKAWLEAAIEDGLEIPSLKARMFIRGSSSFVFQKACTNHWLSIPRPRASA